MMQILNPEDIITIFLERISQNIKVTYYKIIIQNIVYFNMVTTRKKQNVV